MLRIYLVFCAPEKGVMTMVDALEADIDRITSGVLGKQKSLDEVMGLSRRTIMGAGRAITMLHSGRTAEAHMLIGEMKADVTRLKRYDDKFLHHSMQAYQEYAEAVVFYAVKTRRTVPGARAVGINDEAYLMGLMDVVGELKRELLEALRESKRSDAEFYFALMKRIYDGTRGLRFAESVLPGFRRKQDVARIQVESAGSEMLHSSR